MRFYFCRLTLIFLCWVSALSVAKGDTVAVTNTNDSGPGSLRQAIAAANSGDTVFFSLPANSIIDLTTGELVVTKTLSIIGPGANLLTVRRSLASGTPAFRVFQISPSTSNASVVIADLTISNGSAGNGGGIFAQYVALTIRNCTISANRATGAGGGVFYFRGTAFYILNSTISGNVASGDQSGLGGGVYVIFDATPGASAQIRTSTLSGNNALQYGGGLYYVTDSQGTNQTLALLNCTVTRNGSTFGGGVLNENGDLRVRNTIIAGNETPIHTSPDFGGSLDSEGYNLIGDITGTTVTGTSGTGNQFNVDPKLGPLQDNGGPTFTHALLPGSPAIDAGLSGGYHVDQRLLSRPTDDPAINNAAGGDGSDIGAYEVQAPAPAVLGNISTRLRVETGDNALFAGFIVTGTQKKKILVRALGPSLPVPGPLANPTLELYMGSTLLEENDNWVDSPNKQAISDTTIPPPSDLESAIIGSAGANNTSFTAVVRGAFDGTGVALLEIYDLDRSVDSKLANISTRGLVQSGDNILIAGTILLGQAAQKVIVRAIGPSLSLPGKLENPTLELRNGNGSLIDANDNWVDSPNKQAIINTGIPPSNNLESAIVATLPANNAGYTAIVHGVNNTTGIAVVEVYALN